MLEGVMERENGDNSGFPGLPRAVEDDVFVCCVEEVALPGIGLNVQLPSKRNGILWDPCLSCGLGPCVMLIMRLCNVFSTWPASTEAKFLFDQQTVLSDFVSDFIRDFLKKQKQQENPVTPSVSFPPEAKITIILRKDGEIAAFEYFDEKCQAAFAYNLIDLCFCPT